MIERWGRAASFIGLELLVCRTSGYDTGDFQGELAEWSAEGPVLGYGSIRDGWLVTLISPEQEVIRGLTTWDGQVIGRGEFRRGALLQEGVWQCQSGAIVPWAPAAGVVGPAEVRERGWVRSCAGLSEIDPSGAFEVDAVEGPCDFTVIWENAEGQWCSEPTTVDFHPRLGPVVLNANRRFPYNLCAHLFDGGRVGGWIDALGDAAVELEDGG